MSTLCRIGFGGIGKSGGILAPTRALEDFLGTAKKCSVTGSTIGNSGATNINWDICISPAPGAVAGTAVTCGGTINLNTPKAARALLDVENAYLDFWKMPVTSEASGTLSGDMAGLTLPGGVYKSNSVMSNSGTFTLFGDSSTVFIFLVNGAYTPAAYSNTVLAGPGGNLGIALARNVYFAINGAISAGASANLVGNFLCRNGITLGAAASVQGRLLSTAGIAFSANNITTTS